MNTEAIKQLRFREAKLREEVKNECGFILREAVKDIFEEYPHVESLGWNQYTPYFNDGDECVFCIDTDYIILNGVDDFDDEATPFRKEIIKKYDLPEDTYFYSFTKQTPAHEEYLKLIAHLIEPRKQMREILKAVGDDILKNIFGDHVTVTIHRDGRVITEDYEHD